jgi:hypothetical protein
MECRRSQSTSVGEVRNLYVKDYFLAKQRFFPKNDNKKKRKPTLLSSLRREGPCIVIGRDHELD